MRSTRLSQGIASCVIPKASPHISFHHWNDKLPRFFFSLWGSYNPFAPDKNIKTARCDSVVCQACIKHFAKSLISLRPQNHSPRWMNTVATPFYKEESWGSERLSHLPRSHRKGVAKWRSKPRFVRLQKPMLLTTHFNPVPMLIWKMGVSASQMAFK